MTKYYLQNGQEVKIGDKITITKETPTPYGMGTQIVVVPLTQPLIPKLIADGIITKDGVTLASVFEGLRSKAKMSPNDFRKFIETLYSTSMANAFTLLLKEVSAQMNSKTDFSSLKVVYGISVVTGQLIEIPTNEVRNFDTFAPFTSKSQVRKALNILNWHYSQLYDNK